MGQRVPDEYFRPAAESDDVRAGDSDRRRSRTRAAAKAVAPADIRVGWTARAVATLAVVVVGASFTVGRLWVFPPEEQPRPEPAPSLSVSAMPSPSASPDVLAPYDGAVTAVQAIAAEGRCVEGGSRDAAAGAGRQQRRDDLAVSRRRRRAERHGALPGVRTLVGLRVVNGNTVWTDRYLAERRILTIRWTFADGSFFEQGLAANDRTPQEVRFPETDTDRVTLTILEVHRPRRHQRVHGRCVHQRLGLPRPSLTLRPSRACRSGSSPGRR